MRDEPLEGRCPVCKAAGTRTPFDAEPTRDGPRLVRHCGRCGWCSHAAYRDGATCPACGRRQVPAKAWGSPADLPRPAGMDAEEFAVRAGLFVAWKTSAASLFLGQLAVVADFFADRGSPEEAAARADWRTYGQQRSDPRGWWQWTAPGAAGWVKLVVDDRVLLNGKPQTVINDDRARLGRTYHNAGYFLCWPPGFVRFTAPLYHDHTRWRVTVQPERSTTYSEPVEKVHPAGYATLFHPPGCVTKPKGETARIVDPGPDLFSLLDVPG